MIVRNLNIYKMDCSNNMAALGSCSHCFWGYTTDSGARTVNFENMNIDEATVPKVIRYQYPNRAIYHDRDGTLVKIFTDENSMSPWTGGWTVPFFKHNNWSGECYNDNRYNGHVCKPTVQVRRLSFFGPTPTDDFKYSRLNIFQWDEYRTHVYDKLLTEEAIE